MSIVGPLFANDGETVFAPTMQHLDRSLFLNPASHMRIGLHFFFSLVLGGSVDVFPSSHRLL